MSIFVRIKFAKIYLNLSMRNIYKVIAVAALALMPIMTLRAQTQAEIEMAKSMARSYGYSESEIEAMVNKQTSSGSSTDMKTVPPTVNRNEEMTVADVGTPGPEGGEQAPAVSNIYGHNIFQSPNLNFVPSYNIPTPANYKLAAGDEIVIDLWGATYSNYTFTISPEGSITIPNVGPVYLAGNTVEDAEKRVREKFSTIYSGLSGDQPNTFLRLTIGRIRSFTINVVGDAVRPGTYTLPSLSTVFSAIYLAGGPTDLGSVRDIRVYRNNRLAETLDVYDFIINGDFSKNIRLEDNDLIMIAPYTIHVSISGSIKRPMMYDMKDGETVADLLKYAAGFSDNANTQLVQVRRTFGERLETFNVMASDFASFELKDGDVVNVGANIGRNKNIVSISGAVWHPGSYAFTEEVSTVRELIDFAGGLRDDAFMQRGYIERLNEVREPVALYFSLEEIISGAKDIPLCNEDNVRIYSHTEFEVATTVSTRGFLNNPTTLTFREGMTLGDAILLSGDFAIGASRTNVDVARRNIDSDTDFKSDTVSIVFNFNLLEDPSAVDFKLAPYDIISVRPTPSYKPQQGITVNGEVVFPGYYVIESNVVRLSEVIERSGGCTDDAYLEGATISRLMSEQEYQRALQAAHLALREEGVDSSMVEIPSREQRYRIGVDMVRALEEPGSYSDIVLQTGDVVSIPKMNNTVKISGAVLYPNVVAYRLEYNVKDYINMAGGYVKGAIKNKKYIVYMNGTAATKRSRHFDPMPGCEIIIPMKDRDNRNRLSAAEVAALASSTASVATMVVTLVNLLK